MNALMKWSNDPKESLEQMVRYAERSIELDDQVADGHGALAWARSIQGDQKSAIVLAERALELAPGDTGALGLLGLYLQKDMQPARAVEFFKRATRADPMAAAWIWENFGEALVMKGDYEEAIFVYKTALERGAGGFVKAEVHLGLAVAFDGVGDETEARSQLEQARENSPQITLSFLRGFARYADQEYKDAWLAKLKRLGVPEE